MNKIEFGKDRPFKEFCPRCGRPIYEGDKGCPVYHSLPKVKRDKKLHGKSKSVNRWNNYD